MFQTSLILLMIFIKEDNILFRVIGSRVCLLPMNKTEKQNNTILKEFD